MNQKFVYNKRDQRATSSLPQAGAQLVRHFVSNSCFRLSSEPLQYPRLRQAAASLEAMLGDSAARQSQQIEMKLNYKHKNRFKMKKIVFIVMLVCCFSETYSQKMFMSWGEKDIEGWTEEKWELSQKLTKSQLLDMNLTAESWSDFFAILNASINNYKTNQEYLNDLVEQITDMTETILKGTGRLIIWERIISGDIIFEGKGLIIENDIFKVSGRANQLLQNLTNKNFGYVSINSTEKELLELKNKWLGFLANKPVAEYKEPEFKNAKMDKISSLKAFNALVVSLKSNPQKEEIIKNCLKNVYNLDEMPKDKSSSAIYCNPDNYTFFYLAMLIGDKNYDENKNSEWWQNFWNKNKDRLVWNTKKGYYEVK